MSDKRGKKNISQKREIDHKKRERSLTIQREERQLQRKANILESWQRMIWSFIFFGLSGVFSFFIVPLLLPLFSDFQITMQFFGTTLHLEIVALWIVSTIFFTILLYILRRLIFGKIKRYYQT